MFLKLGGNYEFNNSIYAHQPFSSHVVSPSTPDRPSFPSPTQMLSSGTIIASIILTKRQRNPKYHNHGISYLLSRFLIVLCQVRLGTTFGAVLLKDALQRPPPHPLTSHQTTHLNAFPARDSAIKGSFTDRGPPLTSHQTTHLNAFPARNLRFSSVSWRPHEALNFIFRVFATCYITICIFNESYLQPIPVPAQYVYMFNILSSKVTCSQYQYQYQQNMYLQ